MLLSGGVIAQMGERLNGIQEVGSSILPGSTKENRKVQPEPARFPEAGRSVF